MIVFKVLDLLIMLSVVYVIRTKMGHFFNDHFLIFKQFVNSTIIICVTGVKSALMVSATRMLFVHVAHNIFLYDFIFCFEFH